MLHTQEILPGIAPHVVAHDLSFIAMACLIGPMAVPEARLITDHVIRILKDEVRPAGQQDVCELDAPYVAHFLGEPTNLILAVPFAPKADGL